MARTEASIKAFMIATQLKKQHFKSTPIGLDIDAELSCKDDLKGWSQAELDTLGDYRLFANTIVAKIEDGTDAVVEVAYALLHNMDECDVWNEFKCEYEETPVDDHIHVFCTLSKGVTITEIAAAIGIEPNMIEKPKRGCKAIDNMTAYIIHAKDAQKFQYDPHDVCTVRGEDYVDVWRKRKKAWDKGRSQKTAKRNIEDVRWLIDKARFGQVTIDQVIATPEYYEIYSLPENTAKIDAAFDAWERKCMRETVLAMERHEFSTTVLFVYGVEGVGKTILVRALNKYWRSVYGWGIANLAAKNSMDDYRAQEVIWLDDVTGSAMSAGDWLKLLDPENANNISARYRNKGQIAPKVIIINSNMRPLEFFYFAKEVGGGERSELMGRFFRRLMWYVTVLNPWDIGVENCLLQHPVRVEPYVAYLPPNANNVRHSVQNLTWRFEDAIGDLSQITAYLLAEYIVRIVDEATGGFITSKADADTVFALVQDYVYDEQRPAMKAGKYPVFDPPDKSINANTNLLNKTVQPRALLEAHNESDTVPTKAVNEEEYSDDNEVIVTVDEVPSLFMI